MDKNFFLPVSSFVFPELASAEAVSPTRGDVAGVFVGRGSCSTKTSGELPVNPVDDLLILYSEPVTWKYKAGRVMDYPLVIEIPESLIDLAALSELEPLFLPEGLCAWAYSRTIFFPNNGSVKYLFRSTEEMHQQLDRLSSFQEVKNLALINTSCMPFEKIGRAVLELPDSLAEEIRREILTKGISLTKYEEDLQKEVRAGACLGFSIASIPDAVSNGKKIDRAENFLTKIGESGNLAKAKNIYQRIIALQHEFAEIVSRGAPYDYGSHEITFKAFFRYDGRDVAKDWNRLDPILRMCVDFIAAYPRKVWNWYGNEERLEFMKRLWNEVLGPCVKADKPDAMDAMRKDVASICSHFKSPNAGSLDPELIASPLLQSLYIVLLTSGDPRAFIGGLKNAKRRDICFCIYGALKGYSYFPRTLIPERLSRAKISKNQKDFIYPITSEQSHEMVCETPEPFVSTAKPDSACKKTGATKWIHTGRQKKRVPVEDVDAWCAKGWELGQGKKTGSKETSASKIQDELLFKE